MSIPTYEQLMRPFLEILSDGNTKTYPEMVNLLSDKFNLTKEEREAYLPSGAQTYMYNRAGWARTHLKKSGLIDYEQRGVFKITERGKQILEKYDVINNKVLEQFPEFVEFFHPNKTGKDSISIKNVKTETTPKELVESYFVENKNQIVSEVLEKIMNNSPFFFEKLVINVLLKLGYGSNFQDARTTLKTNDEGIDGIINEDKLGLDIIYIQAKRWKDNVGRVELQKFAGALQGKKAKKGVFITTSDFHKNAIEYVNSIDSKIILVNGEMLANLMIDHGIGVTTKFVYKEKEIDSDYFIED